MGPAGDSLYQSQREEKKLMVDSEASSTSSEKGEISIMEEGEFSDDDMNGLQNNSEKNLKDNDTNEDRVKVTEVVDITEISSSKTEQSYTATPTRILRLVQIDKGQKTRCMLSIGGMKFETCANTINNVPDSVLFKLINANSIVMEGRSTYVIDRDPKHFPVILNYLRNGGRYHSDMLPRDLRQLKELQVEAAFYELKHLELNI